MGFSRNILRGVFVCIVLALLASSALAAGYGVREFGATAMGSAYAGASAGNGDPTFLAYNPAAASGGDGLDWSVGLVGVWPTSEASFSDARTVLGGAIGGPRSQSDFVDPAYVPTLALRYRLGPEWSVGASVTAPWGLSTTYDLAWAGRYHAHETKLATIDVVPVLAYQPVPELTLAAGPQIQFAWGRLSNAIDVGTIGTLLGVGGALPTLEDGYGAFDAQDWGVGYMLGLQWAPSPNVRVGASFRSEVAHRMTGPVAFSQGPSATGAVLAGFGLLQDTRGTADLTTPAVASVGVAIDLSEHWALAGEVAFTDWSVFKELRVQFANPLQPDEVTVFDWHDSWFGSIGATYKPAGDWAFRFGGAYDQSPAGAARNARIPDADRYWLAVGADLSVTERTTLTFSVAHLFVPEEPISLSAAAPSNVFRGDLAGVTDAEATAVGIGLTFR